MRIVVALFAAAAVVMPAALTWAETAYYIELGSESSEEEAITQWQELSSKFEDIIGNLQFHPSTVIHSENRVMTRIQAGPLDSKAKAQKICLQLFDRDTPCFVIEEERQAGDEVKENAEPETAEAADGTPPSGTEEEKVILPWLFGGNASKRDAKVDVAEAIHVPLTEGKQSADEPEIRPVFKSDPEPVAQRVTEDMPAVPEAEGWVNVGAFLGEDDAMAFWQDARGRSPAKAAGLRVRILKPLLDRNKPKVTLNIGPFAGEPDAMAFCAQVIQSVDPNLNCRFARTEPRDMAQYRMPRYEHNNLYDTRRKLLMAKRGQRSSMNAPVQQSKQYWAQIITAPSQVQALKLWDSLRQKNSDLLGDKRSSISAALIGRSEYVVRVGPMSAQDEALTLCKSLKERGISCKIYANM